ncbi:hypothetical protein POP15_051 [Pectobacterium phage POP15]|nr:hypothetical protein POP15_051 [Pectobacterium phage POP15]
MKDLFVTCVKLFGLTFMMAVITTPGISKLTSQEFKDKYHAKCEKLAKGLEGKINNIEKSFK